MASLLVRILCSALCLHCALGVSKVSFKRVYANYPKHIFEAQGTVLNGELVVMGGFYKFPGTTKEVYRRVVKAGNAKWRPLAPMLDPVTHVAQVARGATFCGAGGYWDRHPGKSVPFVSCFDKGANKWTRLPNLPAPRAGGGLVFHGKHELVFAGGVHRQLGPLRHTDYGDTWTLDLRNPARGWVDTGAKMPNPRNHMAAVETCGRYFWVGGQHKEEEAWGNQATVSEYLPDAKVKWRNVAPLPKPLGHISASVMAYKCGILVVAGTTQGYKRSSDVFYYNAAANKWKKVGNLPVACTTPVCGIKGNQVMCATGDGPAQNRAYVGTIS